VIPRLTLAELVPVLQTAIGPVILVSGIGLLLLTMTNRLGRVIDRSRLLAGQLGSASQPARESFEAQIQILWRRARLIRGAIALASTSALLAAVLIIVLFVTASMRLQSSGVIAFLFIACMLCLIGSLLLFIGDVDQSWGAVGRGREGGWRSPD
jgi:hypothetical protein